MRKLHHVVLSQAERKQLFEVTRKGKSMARDQAHARVLLQADEGNDGLCRSDAEIHNALGVAISTISRILGHSSVKVTETVYDHIPVAKKQAVMDRRPY